MKLKINDDIIIPNLISVYQSFDVVNNFESRVTASFGDLSGLTDLIPAINETELDKLVIVDDYGIPVTTFNVKKLEAADKNLTEDQLNNKISQTVTITLRFS